MNFRVVLAPTPSEAAARLGADLLARALGAREGGRSFSFAVSGGSTPVPLWAALAGPLREEFPWKSTDVFWADERMVPPSSSDSNFGLVQRSLLDHVPLPAEQVHRIHGETDSPKSEARRYESELRRVSEGRTAGSALDVVLLGVGPDGHTASLFPGRPALEEHGRWVVEEMDPGRPPFVPRVTLTLPAIALAEAVFVLVTGAEKRPIVEAVWRQRAEATPALPSARVAAREELVWYLDRSAAPTELVPGPSGTTGSSGART